MAVNLNTAKQFVQSRGVTPPEGIQSGTPQYDQWATEYLTNAVNAGDPAAIQASGGAQQVADQNQGYTGVYADWQSAAPSSEWLGKRMPTPSELRRYYNETGRSEDLMRFDDRQVAAWLSEGNFDFNRGGFIGANGQLLDKPTETGGAQAPRGGRGGGGFGGGGRGGNLGSMIGGRGGFGTFGGAPGFNAPAPFAPPSYQDAVSDPGYQFALKQGQDALERSAAAQGVLRTGGTLKDLINFGQQAGAQQYQNVYDRALQTYGTNYGRAKDIFAPQYGSWQTAYQGDLSKWTTRYGGNLQKDLLRESNIYNLLNTPPPSYPGY